MAAISPPHITAQILPLYREGQSIRQIAERLNISQCTVGVRVRKAGIKRPKQMVYLHQIDATYFEIIDTEQKAYWLGFLYADGCVNSNDALVLVLAAKDKAHVEQFKKDVGYTGPVYTKAAKTSVIGKKVVRSGFQYGIAICRKKLCEDLIRLGCTRRKSLTLQFPTPDQVPDHLLRHFIRGYFDGDGSISRSKEGNRDRYKVSILGTAHFLKGVQDFLEKQEVKRTKLKSKGCQYDIGHGGNNVVKRIHAILYHESTRSLERKRLLFEDCKNQYTPIMGRPINWLFQRENGEMVEIHNLDKYCKEHGLNLLNIWNGIRTQNGKFYQGLKFIKRL